MRYADAAAWKPKSEPPFVLDLEPSDWVPTWRERPAERVRVGVRGISLADMAEARIAAGKAALEAHPEQDDAARIVAFEDELLAWVVARCTCEPDDAAAEFGLWGGLPQDAVKERLAPAAIRRIFDAFERLTIINDPTTTEATDDEIVRLPDVYADAAPHLFGEKLSRVRRLLRFVLDELDAVTPKEEVDDDE